MKSYLIGKRDAQRRGEKFVVISHNALFDMCLLAWRFGIVPDLMIDTMGIARAKVNAFTGSVSLASVAKHLGIGVKGDTIGKVIGMRKADIKSAGLWDAYARYACNDGDLCREIWKRFRKDFPPQELLVMDMVLRAAITPRFKLNQDLLAVHLNTVKAAKQDLLARTGIMSKDDLMSNDKFADALRALGVEPETKTSPTTGKATYAFAKTDAFMASLDEHPNPDVQALVAARLGFKSTLEETRTQRLLTISQLTWPGNLGSGWMPIPLKYSGAHTHRLSGDWQLNMQNLGRGSPLRSSLEAPDGYVVVVADASQIEARLVAWQAGQDDLVASFARNEDIYSNFAGQHVYHRPVNKKDHPKERFVGKQAILGLGYGMGKPKFYTKVKSDSRLQLGEEIDLGIEGAGAVVDGYRKGFAQIPKAWKTLDALIPQMAHGDPRAMFGPCEVRHQEVILPNGLSLYYPKLTQEVTPRGGQWVFRNGKRIKFLWGGTFLENLTQALARVCNFEAALRLRKEFPRFRMAHQVHDELIYVVPGRLEFEQLHNGKTKTHVFGPAREFRDALIAFLSTPPAWGPAIPLAAEGDVGLNYGDAK
ncbi:DNA polymerase [Methylobacterium sp. 285MFTsu5.1]|uniref:DNA polymerase n=1 Tax=Methylobacterium sp. 285MFTsu5.1 TaxID=1172187 RepID=UPI00131A3732|nr:DNA polymerase [Methylobacterium sp. 285MFTsu5.1]